MSMRSKPPFRADHVGSLLRPAALKTAREQSAKGEIDAAVLKAIEDREIERVIKKQEEAGLQSITDGEFRRSWWHLDFLWGLDGVEKHVMDSGVAFAAVTTRNEGVKVAGKTGVEMEALTACGVAALTIYAHVLLAIALAGHGIYALYRSRSEGVSAIAAGCRMMAEVQPAFTVIPAPVGKNACSRPVSGWVSHPAGGGSASRAASAAHSPDRSRSAIDSSARCGSVPGAQRATTADSVPDIAR